LAEAVANGGEAEAIAAATAIAELSGQGNAFAAAQALSALAGTGSATAIAEALALGYEANAEAIA